MVCLYLVLVIAVSAAAVSPARAMRAELWERWTAHDPGAAAQLNHIAWDYLLDTYLRRAGTAQLFDYRGVTPRDRLLLDDYVESLAGVPISRYARPEQLAFWINLYNAVTVKVVLDAYPIGSIREVDSLFRLGGPWDEKRLTVEGEKLSLDEHRAPDSPAHLARSARTLRAELRRQGMSELLPIRWTDSRVI